MRKIDQEASMKRLTGLLTVVAVLTITGCGIDDPLEPGDPQFHKERAGSPALNIVTYNVYVGAHVEDLLTADPSMIPMVAAGLWGDVLQTNFSARAHAIAKQIAAADAHIVGLQEVALYRLEAISDFDPFAPLPVPLPAPDAEYVILDFLDSLLLALEAKGMTYEAVAVAANLDVELPMCTDVDVCLPFADIRLTDRDVILVRGDVNWDNAAFGNFAAMLPIIVDDELLLMKPSGWTSVDIVLKGLPYRVFNTHLEPADVLPGGMVHPDIAAIQAGQLEELMGMVEASSHPVIMVGDFNSDDDGSTTATYQAVRDSGFADTWLVGRPRGDGYTGNQSPDLMNEESELFHRIDYIFYRDEFSRRTGGFLGSVAAQLIGEEQCDKTPSGLWPSDHAGVAATLRIAPRMR
jgi:endonuclease/exonuclease/phosphatase family metal-dependent hydrolase